MDISKLSLADLIALQEQVQKEIKKRQNQEVARAREQIIAIAQGVGIPLKELIGTGVRVKNGPAAVRYRHPTDAALRWAGRGRQPQWVKDWLASGESLDTLRV
jgi:DNA-binding protein H-NS